ncbi:MAG TPA: YafY family protein [Bacillus sp. (in: firmicutes)]|nr:YafY family protein [Bacillus sp. (in: firmicutes)]
MSKSSMMLSILWLLKSGRRITAKEIADALEINIRTVYRYIDSLCASGVPIIADSGHNGGYSLLHDLAEAPLFFDIEEQKALNHAAIYAQESGYPFSDALNRAITKLNLYTNETQQSLINRHTKGFDIIQPPADPSIEATLQILETAVAESRTLIISYQKGKSNTFSNRHLDPYGLVHWKNRWYIVGYCHLRQEIRSFRVDRIVTVTETELTFNRPEDFSIRSFFLKSLLPDTDSKDTFVTVKIHAHPQVIKELSSHWSLWPALVDGTETEAHFKLKKEIAFYYLPYSLLPYGRAIEILEPVEIKEQMLTVLENLLQHYQKM